MPEEGWLVLALRAVGQWALCTAGALILALAAGNAVAQEPDGTRVALIIGNSNYEAVGILPNPVSDATAVAEAFTRLGFDVTLGLDLDYGETRRALQDFELKVATADVAVVFFAGHGIEIEGVNYIIPTDAQLKRDTHVLDEAVPLDRIVTAVEQADALRLIILDACRDNPFVAQMEMSDAARSVSRGLGRVEPGGSTIIAYAAREGTTADDGAGEHSPYTTALLSHLETPGLEVTFVFRRIRDDVMEATGGVQEPVVYASLGREEIYFIPAEAAPVPVQTPVVDAGDQGNAAAAYQAALAIDTIEAWESFLRYYSTGLYADLARAALNKLRDEQREGADLGLAAPDPPEIVADVAAEPALAAIEACDRYAAYQYDNDRPESVAPVPDTELAGNARAALDACRLAAELNPGDRRMQYQFARAAAQAGRNDEAYQAATRAAEFGSAQAMVLAGLAHQFGLGAIQSYGDAAAWYLRAAEAGSSDGMLQLGYLYDQGLGVPFDLDESGRWFARAAEAGNAAATAAIAYRFEQGRGVDQDPAEARYWYERAAERGDVVAMQGLAAMYENGVGGAVDLAEALRWYRAAADGGLGIAMASLGWLHENGIGIDVDLDAARDWYQRGAAAGDHVSMFALGRIYEQAVGVAQDYGRAAEWYAQAALTGELPYALVRLGTFFDEGLGVTQDFATARDLWEEAAAAGEADALHNLGHLYEEGRGVPADIGEASRYYIEALAAGSTLTVETLIDRPDDHSAALRRAVESYLVDRGFLAGKPDGIFDDATRAAIAALAGG